MEEWLAVSSSCWQATPSITKFLSSKSLSIFSVGENAREKDLAYFSRMEKLSEIKLPLKSCGQFYYFIWETYLPRDIRDVHWASKIVESNAVSGLIVAVAASESFQLMKLFSRHEMEFPCVAMWSSLVSMVLSSFSLGWSKLVGFLDNYFRIGIMSI